MHTPATNASIGRARRPARAGHRLRATGLVLLGAVLAASPAVLGGLPEPDAVVYGTIALQGQPVTAADAQISVEARRSPTGPAIATTTVGAESGTGNFYILRLPVESGPPVTHPDASLLGDTLFIVVTEAGVFADQATVILGNRGEPQRIDIGVLSPDLDNDTLPDDWEIGHYGVLDYGPASLALNGQTLLRNYVAGTDPNEPDSAFAVMIGSDAGQIAVGFLRRRAEGPGYLGRTRYYTLQSSPTPEGSWEAVSGFVAVPGDNQALVYIPSPTSDPAFYRARVWLE